MLAAILLAPSPAAALRPLTTGVTAAPEWGFAHVAQTGARFVRKTVSWRSVAPTRPRAPRNPRDPAYQWGATDEFVKSAAEHGRQVLLTVDRAPEWAEGPGNGKERYEGTWKPDAAAFGDFAQALATRYSGTFLAPGLPLSGRHIFLPRVRYFEAWTESNLSKLLEPQWENGKAASPGIYRRLANAFTAGVKSVHQDNMVIGPGLAPYGDPPRGPYSTSGPRMRPITFLRSLFCLKDNKELTRTKDCAGRTQLDIISHHPINTTGGPSWHAANPDDAASADLDRVTRVVRAAVRAGTLLPKRKHPLWATETWWPSNPPSDRGQPPKKQARWVEEALHLWWQDGASAVFQQPLRDSPTPVSGFGGGLYFANGKPKPALRAFRFPFVADRKSKRKVKAWGKTPKGGKLKIQAKVSKHRKVQARVPKRGHGHHHHHHHGHHHGKGWKTVAHLKVRAGQVFQKPVKVRGKAQLRAKVGKAKSLPWKL